MTPRRSIAASPRELALGLPVLALVASLAAHPAPRHPAPGARLAAPSDTIVVRNVGFRGPENLVYDSVADLYYVSNVNGQPAARDGNGYISRVAPDGRVRDLQWIRGGRNGATLDGPMGIAIRGDTLAVADIGTVRFFDRRTGRPLGTVTVPGGRLNDLAYTDDGALWVTDVGPNRQHGPNGALQVDTTHDMDAVYRIVPGRPGGHVQTVARGLELDRPDGVTPWPNGTALVTTFGDSVLERIGPADSGKMIVKRLPGGRVDGLRPAPGGGWFVTSWDAKTVWRWRVGDSTLVVAARGITSPAGVTVDTRHSRLAITSMQDNALYLVPLPRERAW